MSIMTKMTGFALTIFFALFVSATCAAKKETLLHGIFWEVKPFIFTNEHGDLDGILPMVFKRAQHFCIKNESLQLMDFTIELSSRQEFNEYLRSNDKMEKEKMRKLKGIKGIVWAPITSTADLKWEDENKYRSFSILKTEQIAVIVPRHFIDLPNKILRGIVACKPIFIIASLLVVILGVVIWLIEKRWNKDFHRSFIKGSGTGFWWSIVSMTTVGYGDIVPKSPLGRSIAVIWLIIGVMIACVMTATMTEVVSGIGDLSVYGKTVAVLENSYEEKVAKMDYRAITVTGRSYEEVLEMVRQNKAFAALINADVAAWYQDEITDGSSYAPLHIIEKIPANLNLQVLINLDLPQEAKEAFGCMVQRQDEIYKHSIEYYQRYCHTETTYIGSFQDLVMKNTMVQALIILAGLALVIGLLFDLYVYFVSKRKGKNFCSDTVQCCKGLLGHNGDSDQEEEYQLTAKM